MPLNGGSRTPRSSSYLETWNAEPPRRNGRLWMLWLLAAVYVPFGCLHVLYPHSMLAIMPPPLPFKLGLIVFTGACEIAGGIGLLLPWTRRLAAVMLAIYALCVWPANIYQALWHVHVAPLPDSWWYHGPRLAFQPVLIWWPLFAARVIDWPFAPRRPARS